jgi:hypothetical protein
MREFLERTFDESGEVSREAWDKLGKDECRDRLYFMEPNIEEFKEWLKEKDDIKLSEYQIDLAYSYIDYKKKVFSGGLRSGRTTVLGFVGDYFMEKYPFVTDEI